MENQKNEDKLDKKIKVIIAITVIAVLIILMFVIILLLQQRKSIDNNKRNIAQMNLQNDDSRGINESIKNIMNDTTNTSSKTTEKITNEKKYASVIAEYKEAVNDPDIEKLVSINNKYPYVNEWMVLEKARSNKTNSSFDFAYSYYDIDKNGSDELIMLAVYNNSIKPTIIDIYTYNDNQNTAQKILDDSSLGDRANAKIYSNGIILVQGSNGADNGIIEFTQILPNGYSVKHNMYYYKSDNINNFAFYNNFDDMNNEKNKLKYTTFEEIENEYIKNATIVNIESFTKIN